MLLYSPRLSLGKMITYFTLGKINSFSPVSPSPKKRVGETKLVKK
jgi:hypothetical protein